MPKRSPSPSAARRPSVIVLVMEGCGACHEFMPRFGKLAAPYRAAGMPVSIYDVDKHAGARQLGAKLRVTGTPTTIVIGPKGPKIAAVGAIDDAEIAKLLADAAAGQ